ncbi:MAG: hypothetical protein ACOYL6_02170 [Bacteriovoracaceae bacterium]
MTRNSLFFVLLFLSACAFHKSEWKTVPSKEIEQRMMTVLSKVCLDGEGKAKISHAESKSFLSYSSLLKPKDKEWAIGFDVPFHGEETLVFNWNHFPESPFSISGTIASQLESNHFLEGETQVFFEGLVSFLDWIMFAKNEPSSMDSFHCWGQSDTENENGRCQLDFKNSSSQEVTFKQDGKKSLFFLPFGEKKSVVMSLDIENEKYFERVAFSIVENGEEKRLSEKDGMEFSVKSCTVR